MNILKIILIVLLLPIWSYSIYVGVVYGLDIFGLFFGEIQALTWQEQFNLDFMTYLILSALWIAWRNKFSGTGIILAVLASILGMMFFGVFLLVLVVQEKGNLKAVLVGKN